MKLLVTGASGFIGQNLVERLIHDGHQVRAVYRRPVAPERLSALQRDHADRLELVRLDLAYPDSMPDLRAPEFKAWQAAARNGVPELAPDWPIADKDLAAAKNLLSGMDACVHIAARVIDWGRFEEFFASNVNPVRVLLEAARESGLKRFVYCSSMAVHGFGHHRGSTEAGPYYRVGNPYPVSKRMSESLVNTAAAAGFDVVTIRPGNVYGPGDTTTFYPFLDTMVQGVAGTLGGGRSLTCPVFVDDLVDAFVRAIMVERPTARCFDISSGETITWRQLTDLSSDALGLKRAWINLPAWLMYLVAPVLEGLFRLIRSKTRPPFTWYLVTQLLHDYRFDIETARGALGYSPRVMAPEGVARTVAAWKADRTAGTPNAAG